MAATEVAFAERVAWKMAWMIAFMSTFGDGTGDRAFGVGTRDRTWGVWGAGVVRARAAKAGSEEATGEFVSMREGEGGLVGPDATRCRWEGVSYAGLGSVGAQRVCSGRPGWPPHRRRGGAVG